MKMAIEGNENEVATREAERSDPDGPGFGKPKRIAVRAGDDEGWEDWI